MSGSPNDVQGEVRRLGVREFRGNMATFLHQARHGATFLITSRDEVLAEIRPPSTAVLPGRKLGVLRGRIRMADDFDVLPPDVLAAMEGHEGCNCSSTRMPCCGR